MESSKPDRQGVRRASGRNLCPNCQAPLQVMSRWFGFVREYPKRCRECGVRLAYDLAGGVYAVKEPGDKTGESGG